MWKEIIQLADVFHDIDLTFDQRRDAIVQRIRESRWYRNAGEYNYNDLPDMLDTLVETSDVDEFDNVWVGIYDLADRDRIWLGTF